MSINKICITVAVLHKHWTDTREECIKEDNLKPGSVEHFPEMFIVFTHNNPKDNVIKSVCALKKGKTCLKQPCVNISYKIKWKSSFEQVRILKKLDYHLGWTHVYQSLYI